MGIEAVDVPAELPFPASGEQERAHRATRPAGVDWRQFGVSVSTQLQSYVRTSRFWVALGIVAGVGGLITLVASTNSLASTAAGYVGGLTAFVPYLAIVTGALFGGDAISTDFGSKTGYYMLPIPVRRNVLLAGRYVAAVLVSLLVLGVFYGFVIFGGVNFYSAGSMPWGNVGLSFLLFALLMLGILSFAFCLSSMSKSPSFGLVLTIMVLLVVFEIIDAFIGGTLGNNYLWFSILYAADAVSTVIASGFSASGPALWQAVVITGGYAVGFFALALVLFDREET